jgi:hypothetical protein
MERAVEITKNSSTAILTSIIVMHSNPYYSTPSLPTPNSQNAILVCMRVTSTQSSQQDCQRATPWQADSRNTSSSARPPERVDTQPKSRNTPLGGIDF